jgi:hypothetical protein
MPIVNALTAGLVGVMVYVLAHVRQQLHSPMFADGTVLPILQNRMRLARALLVPFKQEYNALLRRLHDQSDSGILEIRNSGMAGMAE